MPKANLTLVGANLSLNADSAKTALATEFQLSEAQVNAACDALFKTKAPFILWEHVELAVAAGHFGRLKSLGIDSEVEVLSVQDTADAPNNGITTKYVGVTVCALAVAISGGYYFYNQKNNQLLPHEPAIVAEHSAQPPNTAKVAEAIESTQFHQWRSRVDRIKTLKRGLHRLNHSRDQAKLLASFEDPLARIVGTNCLTQLTIQRVHNGRLAARIPEHHQQLENSLADINMLSVALDQFYATLELAGVYQQLQIDSAAQSTLQLAKNLVESEAVKHPADIVIANVALAEYHHLYGKDEYRDGHFNAATAIVDSGFENDSENLQEWAIAYIARGEAKLGFFARAHRRLRTISDERITDIAMIDISSYAASQY